MNQRNTFLDGFIEYLAKDVLGADFTLPVEWTAPDFIKIKKRQKD